MSKSIVIYYSSSSHTAKVAALIANTLGIEKEAIVAKEPYGDSLTQRSRSEIENGIDPDILPLHHDLKEYDTIFLGTPSWWNSPATPVLSFCHKSHLEGKLIYPFITTGYDVKGVNEKLVSALKGNAVKDPLIVPFENAFMDIDENAVVEYAKKAK